MQSSSPHKAQTRHISRLFRDIRGQGIVEYALMVALVVLASVAAEQVFACKVGCALENMANQIEAIFSKGKKIPPGQQKKCSKKCD
jgi:Flp pilus assembly pilin Flp